MEKHENGDILVDHVSIELAKEAFWMVGAVFVTTRIIHFILSPGR